MAKQAGLFSYLRSAALKRGRTFYTKRYAFENDCVLTNPLFSLASFINKKTFPIYLSPSHFLHLVFCPIPKSTELHSLWGCPSNNNFLKVVVGLCTEQDPSINLNVGKSVRAAKSFFATVNIFITGYFTVRGMKWKNWGLDSGSFIHIKNLTYKQITVEWQITVLTISLWEITNAQKQMSGQWDSFKHSAWLHIILASHRNSH